MEILSALDYTRESVKSFEYSVDSSGLKIDKQKIVSFSQTKKARKDALLEVLGALSAPSKRIMVSIWDQSTIARRISMPSMTPKELKAALRFEAEKHIPFSVDDCVLDYVILGAIEKQKQMNVMLVATNRGVIDDIHAACEEKGLAIPFIDIHPFAVWNGYEPFKNSEDDVAALVHFAEGANLIYLSHQGEPVIARDLGVTVPTDETAEDKLDALAESIKTSVIFYENNFDTEIPKIKVSGRYGAKALEYLSQTVEKKLTGWLEDLKVSAPDKDSVSYTDSLAVLLGMSQRAAALKP